MPAECSAGQFAVQRNHIHKRGHGEIIIWQPVLEHQSERGQMMANVLAVVKEERGALGVLHNLLVVHGGINAAPQVENVFTCFKSECGVFFGLIVHRRGDLIGHLDNCLRH